jgi:hypothetical protein
VAIEGGCLCGALRYEVVGTPTDESNCHCTVCRRANAAAFVTWFSIPSEGFRVTRGATAHFRSSERGVRGFCARCGTQLTFQLDELPGEIDVTTCSLDDPERLPPKDHTHTSGRISWQPIGDALPHFKGARETDPD